MSSKISALSEAKSRRKLEAEAFDLVTAIHQIKGELDEIGHEQLAGLGVGNWLLALGFEYLMRAKVAETNYRIVAGRIARVKRVDNGVDVTFGGGTLDTEFSPKAKLEPQPVNSMDELIGDMRWRTALAARDGIYVWHKTIVRPSVKTISPDSEKIRYSEPIRFKDTHNTPFQGNYFGLAKDLSSLFPKV